MSCVPLTAALIPRPSTSPVEFQFDLCLHVTLELEEHANDIDTDKANNPLDTMVPMEGPRPAEDPATSWKKGSFYSNKKGTYYILEWANFAEFDTWCQVEEAKYSIELHKSMKWMGGGLWSIRHLFRCRRQLLSGYKYEITNPNQKRVESKKNDCPCNIVIKIYPHTSIILGRYEKDHNHELG